MSFSSILTVMIQSSIEDLVLLWSLPNRPFSLVDFLFPMQIKSCDDTQESVFFQNDRHFHARTQSFYWKRQRFKCPRYRHMIRIGKTKSTSEKGLLSHQGSTLVLELGPHKDKEKLWPGWDLNLRPSDEITDAPPTELQGQYESRPWGSNPSLVTVVLCHCVGPIPILELIPDGIIGYEKLHSSVRPLL